MSLILFTFCLNHLWKKHFTYLNPVYKYVLGSTIVGIFVETNRKSRLAQETAALLDHFGVSVYSQQIIVCVCVCFSLTCVYNSFKLKIVSAVKLNLLFVFLITRKYMKIIENNLTSYYFFTYSIGWYNICQYFNTKTFTGFVSVYIRIAWTTRLLSEVTHKFHINFHLRNCIPFSLVLNE